MKLYDILRKIDGLQLYGCIYKNKCIEICIEILIFYEILTIAYTINFEIVFQQNNMAQLILK